MLINITPLKIYPNYRRLWLGASLSAIGNHVTVFAAVLQIFTITDNSAFVGLLGLFTGIPAIFLALWGSSLGDKFDRKKLLLLSTTMQILGCCLLWLYAVLDGTNIVFIYCLVGLIFLFGAFNAPINAAILPSLVDSKHLPAAIILRLFSAHSAMMLGPLIAGYLATKFGFALLYFIDLLSFCGAFYGIAYLPNLVGPEQSINKKSWMMVKSGFQFVKNAPIILGALYVDFALAFFGMPNILFPAINEAYFGGYADNLGLMLGTISLGSVASLLFSGHLNRLTNLGLWMIIFCCLWALSVIFFALSTSLILNLFFLFIMGGFDSIVASLRSTLIQKATPNEFRARVCALEYIVGSVTPQLGNVRAGLLTIIVTPQLAALIGGFSTLLIVSFTLVLIPQFIKQLKVN